MSSWVADAGPLIFLAKLGRLELLRDTQTAILIPNAVMMEIRAKGDEACQFIEQAASDWLEVREVQNREAVSLLLADLDLGEAEVIALASDIEAEKVLLDDLDGRRFARAVGLSVVGTVGVLLAARLEGNLPSLKGELERLQTAGFWINETLLEEALKAASEWDG